MSESGIHHLVRLGVEMGLAVNDYNAKLTDNLEEVTKLTLAYLAAIKEVLKDGSITNKEVNSYFSLVGQTWGSIQARFKNEYLDALD